MRDVSRQEKKAKPRKRHRVVIQEGTTEQRRLWRPALPAPERVSCPTLPRGESPARVKGEKEWGVSEAPEMGARGSSSPARTASYVKCLHIAVVLLHGLLGPLLVRLLDAVGGAAPPLAQNTLNLLGGRIAQLAADGFAVVLRPVRYGAIW